MDDQQEYDVDERIAALEERIVAIENELKQLDASAGSRALSPNEQERFNRQLRTLQNARTELEQLRAVQARNDSERGRIAQLARDPRNLDGYEANQSRRSAEFMDRVDPSDGRFAERDRARALVGDERRAASRHLSPTQREHVDKLLLRSNENTDGGHLARRTLVTENAAYRSAWWKLTTQTQALLTPEEVRAANQFKDFLRAEYRAMAIGTDAAGGYGVPITIDPTIILTAQGSPNDIINIARVETITNDEWRGISSAGVTWSFDAEATEVGDDSPTLAQPTVPTHKAQGFIPYSIEVGMDYPNFASEMARLLAAGYDELLANKLTSGSGSGEPTGIVTALDANTNVEVTPTTDGALGAPDIYKLWDALPIKYRRTASWMSSTDVMNEVRQFATGSASGGDANFSVNITQESIPKLFGRSYYENDYMGDFTGTTGAANLMVLGDFSNFVVAQRAGMNIELVPHLFGVTSNRPTGQRGWYAWARVGSDSVNDLAFRLLANQ